MSIHSTGFALAIPLLCVALPPVLLPAQDKNPGKSDPRFVSVLTPAEQKSLNDKIRAWFDAEIDLKRAEPSKREPLRKKSKDALDAVEKEWAVRSKGKGDLLKNLGDMRAIFANAVPFKSQTGSGEVKTLKLKDVPGFSIVVPRTYRETNAYRTVVLLPGMETDKDRKLISPPKDWYDKTWRGADIIESTLFVLPQLDAQTEYDPMPDLSKETDTKLEDDRIKELLAPVLGGVHEEYRMDLDRVILDAGKGTSAFALRLATYFPSRFAGLILRHPVEIGNFRLDTLSGMPVLLLAGQDTKAACDQIAKQLNTLAADSCTVLEGKGGYPYFESRTEVSDWVKKVQRDLYRTKVVLVPTSNKYKAGYWVRLGTTEPLEAVSEAERPQFIAEADAKENRITITCKGVGGFALTLNDALVNLDKDVTIVVNGIANTWKAQRNLKNMVKDMVRLRDCTILFPAVYETEVKKPEKTDPEKAEGGKKDGKSEDGAGR